MLVEKRPRAICVCTSASVVESRMLAIASRTFFITWRVPQLASSTHSSHFTNARSLAQGSGASGPSMIRMTCPMVICSGGRASAYPPPFPFLLLSTPAFLQLDQDRLKKLAWDLLLLGKICDQDRPAHIVGRQGVERPERIPGLAREIGHRLRTLSTFIWLW